MSMRMFGRCTRTFAALLLGLSVSQLVMAEPTKAPAWSLKTPTGETVSYPDDARGKPTVLLFWPSWCPFSRALQPYVQDIWEDYRDAGVNVWTINIKERGGDPVQAMKDRGLNFPLLLDGDPLVRSYEITRTPWFVVIDGQQNIVYTRPPNPPTPIDVAKAARHALNELLGDKAVPLPTSYPKPYDLHLRKARPSRTAADAAPAAEWRAWAGDYLASVPPGETVQGQAPQGPVEDGKTALRLARALWTAGYGEDATREQAPFLAFRRDNLWVVSGLAVSGKLGQGFVLVITADTGTVVRLNDGAKD
jgi:thiol-disulfide isomerase/thioredoxin